MSRRLATGMVAIAMMTMLASCSSTTNSQAQGAIQPTPTTEASQSDSSPTTTAATTSAPPSSPATSAPTSAAQPKPVSALLAKVGTPVTTANMPKANASWLAVIQKTMDDGKSLTDAGAGPSTNLMALVDEAAKTSDLDALVKLCYFCATDPAQKDALTKALTQTDTHGRTGFAQVSYLLEHTHAAQGNTVSSSEDFPGFATPQHSTLTSIDHADMKTLGVTAAADYKGIRIQFENVNDGPDGYDGFIGIATNT